MALDYGAILRNERNAARQRRERGTAGSAEQAPGVAMPQPSGGPSAALAASDDRSRKPPVPPWFAWPAVALNCRSPLDLGDYRALPPDGEGRVPESIFYVPDFVTDAEERALRAAVESPGAQLAWASVRGRWVLSLGGHPLPNGGGVAREALPPFCEALSRVLVDAAIFSPDTAPNHVLVNRYEAGQGLMPHSDGPLYTPRVAILSLGGPAALDFWESADHALRGRPEHGGELPAASVLCAPRSLAVFEGEAYTECVHGIAERFADTVHARTANAHAGGWHRGDVVQRGPRLSLTVRHVP